MPPDPSWAPNTSKIDNLSPEEVEELLRSWREAVAEGERLDAEGRVEGGSRSTPRRRGRPPPRSNARRAGS